MARNVKVIVTGSKGFIGSHLVPFLKMSGYTALGIDLKAGEDAADPKIFTDITSVDMIINLAAHINPPMENTVDVARTVAQECQKRKIPLIHISSAAVYEPITDYAKHKKQSEDVIRQILPEDQYLFLRLFNVYGEGGHGVVETFIRQYNDREPMTIYGDGTQTRDFIAVEDVCNAIVRGVIHHYHGVFDIGTKKPTAIHDLSMMFPMPVQVEHRDGDGGVISSQAHAVPSWWRPTYTKLQSYILSHVR